MFQWFFRTVAECFPGDAKTSERTKTRMRRLERPGKLAGSLVGRFDVCLCKTSPEARGANNAGLS